MKELSPERKLAIKVLKEEKRERMLINTGFDKGYSTAVENKNYEIEALKERLGEYLDRNDELEKMIFSLGACPNMTVEACKIFESDRELKMEGYRESIASYHRKLESINSICKI